ncbi:DegT/DnrJ/EryC1/StrS family aminotransferase [Halobacterium bonnevillei]|uniref:Aminotransferase class I/II-fold pyridoxal phosphate-dependent enzyme n=1 Tax=Halobacterium bonnevillei TaxID=2692200 RepID=A0A6B0SPQ4_9EURY|nr:DegT/DnrJ/EryC1/StrS family aminotransferase [Halobacterium bonnevillei]MXR19609.1 aminotransferase class I/II-fold pyridoxal phosphate-dependent enzyme [Halobacterium bonnevillei]
MISIASPDLGDAERDRVDAVISDGQLADGPVVREFESEFAAFCGADHAVATTNGTTALHAAFEALGVGDGDTVVTTPFSFVASANAVRHAGAEPVFADVDPQTLTLDPESVADVVARHDDVAAILAVHLYGTPAEMRPLRNIATDHGLPLVEDAAQAHGATYRGSTVGTLGDVACFSFYPTKNMTAGEGGMVTTSHDGVAERVRRFCDHGRTSGYEHATVGHNFRMTSLCAAIGRAQLEKLPAFNEARRENAAALTDRLSATSVETPVDPAHVRSVYHQYTVRADDREALRDHLADCGVDTGVYYPVPIHKQPAYADVRASLPVAERAADRVLSLPVHPGLSPEDLDVIADAVASFEPARSDAATERTVIDS